jgi:hypothetical protein
MDHHNWSKVMSGLVKGVGKVFKKTAKFVKKNWKPIVAAVAIYFTAGVALSYFGSTSAFAANLPLFGKGALFSKAAVWMGFNGVSGSGLYSTALAAGKVAGVGAAASGAATQSFVGGAGPAGSVAAAQTSSVLSPVAATASKIPGGTFTAAQFAAAGGKTAAAAGAGGGALTATDALIKALNTQTKLSMIKMGVDTISGLLAPDPYEEARKMHALQNASSFGVDREGNDAFGWGKSNVAQLWSGMNKRESGYGSNVGYGQSAGQSQFRDTQFLATAHEQNQGDRMPPQPQAGPQFLQPNNQRYG